MCEPSSWTYRWAEEPREPRPRAVPGVGPGLGVDSGGLAGPAVGTAATIEDGLLPDWVFDPAGGMELAWSRGFNYEAIGEGHYPDE